MAASRDERGDVSDSNSGARLEQEQGGGALSVSGALILVVVGLTFGLRADGVLSADTWFNLRFGQRIVRDGLPRINDDVLVSLGARWVDLQWLGHAAWYLVWAAGGVVGVVLVRGLLMAYVLAAPCIADRRKSLRPALAALLAGIIAMPFCAARSQSFAECLFALSLPIIDQKPSRNRSLALVVLSLVWANMHGSAPLAAVLIGWRWLSRPADDRRKSAVSELTLALLCALALIVTPYGASVFSHYRGTLGNPLLRRFVVEWAAASFRETPQFFAVGAVTALIVWRAKPWRKDVFAVGALGAFVLLGLWSVRHQVWFAIVLARYGIVWLDEALPSGELGFRVRSTRWALPVAIGAALFALAGTVWARTKLSRDGFSSVVTVLGDAAARRERVYVDLAQSDRALMVEPRLRGKLPYDIRFELWSSRDFNLQAVLEKDRSPSGLARWERWDVLWLERPEEYGPVVRALARTGRWVIHDVPPLGKLLRRANLPPIAPWGQPRSTGSSSP
jgi:hypothetical protein